ncbi:hypothetical protein TIFTF001_032151 [Ficus carica]|uniref:Uncharacterized protein n=1 Tax=Ficus carica TaxID=3494 RepID=A0AA88E2V5_FICCA|nr:hypothetical protein TIFTF001_032151 [Ficus carica]
MDLPLISLWESLQKLDYHQIASSTCRAIQEEKKTLESCDDFPLFTGLELNLFSEERKIEEIEKLHERNFEDQVISETSEDSKQAQVHVNSGVEAVAFGDGHQEKCNLLESMSGSANPPTRKSNTTFMVPLTPRSVQKLNAMKENIGTTKRDLVHRITAPHRSKRQPLGDLQKN